MKIITKTLYLSLINLVLCSAVFSCTTINKWWDSEPPCKKYNGAELVAVGKVTKIDILKVPKKNFTKEYQIVYFSIKEKFKGNSDKIIKFRRFINGCSSIFSLNREYIVYSKPDEENAEFYKMTYGFTLSNSDDFKTEIDYLKEAKRGTAGRTISGVLVNSSRKSINDEIFNDGIEGVGVQIRGSKSEYNLKTDKNGKFLLYGLSKDEYKITANLFDWDGKQAETTVDLNTYSCENVYGSTGKQGYIEGSLLLPNGDFAADIELELLSIDPKTNKPDENIYLYETTDDMGRFIFDRIPQGRYVLVHNLENDETNKKTYPRLFFPGVKDYISSSIIEVKNKQVVDLGVFRLICDKVNKELK